MPNLIQADSVSEQFFIIPSWPGSFSLTPLAFTAPAGYNKVHILAVGRYQVENSSGGDTRFVGNFSLTVPDFPPIGFDGYAPFPNELVLDGEVSQVNEATFSKVYDVSSGDVIQVTFGVGPSVDPTGETTSDNGTAASLAVTLTYFNA